MLTAALALSLLAAAPNPPCESPLGLEAAIARAETDPRAVALQESAEAHRRGARATSWLNGETTLSATGGARAWPADQRGPEGSLNVAHDFALSGLGAARARAADPRADAATAARELTLVERRLLATEGWLLVWTLDRALELVGRERALMAELVEKLRFMRAHEAISSHEVAIAEASLVELDLVEQELEGDAFHARLSLGAALGCALAETHPLAPLPDVIAPDRVEPLARERDAIVAREQTLARELEVLSAENAPRLELGLTAEVDGLGTGRGLGLAGVRFPTFEGQTTERASLLAEKAALEGALVAADLAASALSADLTHELEHARERASLVETRLVPKEREAEALATRAFEAGELSVLEVLRARMRVVDAERALVLARSRLVEAELRAHLHAGTSPFVAGGSP